MRVQPPQQAIRFLRWFCREDFIEEIEGDLTELFIHQFEEATTRANWTFFYWVLRYFRPEFFKSFSLSPTAHITMFKHNLLISYRGFVRNKTAFLVNLIGLSSSLTCVFLIFLWVHDEQQVDRFHEKESQLFQVMLHYDFPHGIDTWEYTPMILGDALLEDMPEVEASTFANNRFFVPEGLIIQGKSHVQATGIFASENFFELFSYELLHGNRAELLTDKNNILISEDVAIKAFGTTEDLLGKFLTWRTEYFDTTFQVAGILKNVPPNSTTQFDVVVHFDWLVLADHHALQWNSTYAKTYLHLKEGTNLEAFNEKIAHYLQEKSQSRTWEKATQFVIKYADQYLYGQYENGKQAGGRIVYVRLFSLIACIILLIACINFTNLSTAQASIKMKEIGVKKAIGVNRRTLIWQFLSESILVSFLSLIVAVIGVYLFLPQFNEITDKSLHVHWEFNLILVLLGFVLLTGIVSGSYPAFFLSSFDPIAVLKGTFKTRQGEVIIRQGLVIFQFTLSILFIVGVMVVNQQIAFTQQKYLGYNRDQIICFQREAHEDDPSIFLAELNKIPGVEQASNMVWTILNGTDNGSGYSWTGEEDEKKFLFQSPKIGYNTIETLEMEVIMGRSFSKAYNDDHTKIILNKQALDMMGLKDPIGMILDYGDEQREIIGVVNDFHYGSIHAPIEPMILRFRNWGRDIMLRIQAGTDHRTLKEIEQVYKQFHPEYPFEFQYLDDSYKSLYESEQRVAQLSLYFAFLAIIISCLGVFGLATFTTERRTKEIGIRKILGASEWSIIRLLSKDFTKMVLIAILIAIPIGFLMAQRWLESFAYRTPLSWWIFVIAALLALLIAWLTVGVQTYRAARANPTESLRAE